MSTPAKTETPQAAPSESSNRVSLGLSNRVLSRPEIPSGVEGFRAPSRQSS